MTPTTDNWAQQFASMLIGLVAAGRFQPGRFSPKGTPRRLHSGNKHNDGPGTVIRGRLVRGRFHCTAHTDPTTGSAGRASARRTPRPAARRAAGSGKRTTHAATPKGRKV